MKREKSCVISLASADKKAFCIMWNNDFYILKKS